MKARRRACAAFTLVELLSTVAVIGLLAGLLLPTLRTARIRAEVTRAHVEMRDIAMALTMYHDVYGLYPPARTYCAGMMDSIDDYNELPEELVALGYMDYATEDVFNPGHTYKYITPGIGWANGTLTYLPIWVPEDFPGDGRPVPYWTQKESPVKYALWSVGPSGPMTVFESEAARVPVPRSTWYDPTVRTDGKGVITYIWTGTRHFQSP